MTLEARLEWKGKMQFFGQAGANPGVIIDSTEGKSGPTPMEMLLMGVAGCAAMDVIWIMKLCYTGQQRDAGDKNDGPSI
jgi:uncharacterized OsmC-like protein